jgi:O-antigen/teichoic acid export membrane protein
MNSKSLVKNSIFSILETLALIVSEMVVPRLILVIYGSEYNGLVTSITQFMSVATILNAGIAGATRVALYPCLAREDWHAFSGIVNATGRYMQKVGMILLGVIVALAGVYPFFIDEFGWLFASSLFLIIGLSSLADTLWGITNTTIFIADQKLWVVSGCKIVVYLLNVTISVVLMLVGAPIHLVKLGSAAVFVIYPLVLQHLVRKNYPLDRTIAPDYHAISQRWDAFWHQIALFVMDNVDVIVLTVFTDMLTVSVYSVYNLVMAGIKKVILAFSKSVEPMFGGLLAREEEERARESLGVVELVISSIVTGVYASTAVLLMGFVNIYTKGVSDVNYIRPAFAYILLAAHTINSYRLPYQAVTQAAGHYRQTKKWVILEPVINLAISLSLVTKYGLVGIAVGTLAAVAYKFCFYVIYLSRNIIKRSVWTAVKHYVVSLFEMLLIFAITYCLHFESHPGILSWILEAVVTVIISAAVIAAGSWCCYREESRKIVSKLKRQ